MNTTQTPVEILKQKFGYTQFWPLQEEIIHHILQDNDAVVIMPTGGGKSMVFQIPAIVMEGLTIVLSPLISLMKDQVDALKANGIPAAFYNSSLSSLQRSEIAEKVQSKSLDLLYVSPETLLNEQTLSILKDCPVSMIAIDEAHCISMWGHDFREEYTRLKSLKQLFPTAKIVALTATADKITRQDIIEQLDLQDPRLFVASFDRPNLSLHVAPAHRRFESIYRFIQERPGQAGIIYCLSRKSTENIAQKLMDSGIAATHYHAGMERSQREKAQDDFIHDRVQIVCATIAFGMGIDKSNVRFVIHYNLPKNLEGYYQEIGRAGRDGAKADTLLFYSFGDVLLLKKFAEESGQPEIQLNKLLRMQQYAEAQTCRRKILLSYFNEYLEKDCGNCDVCKNPPKTIEGTILAQKALSATYRLGQNVATGLLIDVLRGSNKREVFERGFHQIKTFGAGRDLPYFAWQYYIMQFVHQGLLEIDYKDHQKLKITDVGLSVLYKGKKVSIVKFVPYVAKKKAPRVKKLTKKERLYNEIYTILNEVRTKLAEEEGIPPYAIFSDVTLNEMASIRPAFKDQMKGISGMSSHKYEKYGIHFLNEIRRFKIENKDRTHSQIISFLQFQKGRTVKEIASERALNEFTIFGHLALAYEWGETIDLSQFVSKEELERISAQISTSGEKTSLGELANKIGGGIPYYKINFGLAHHRLQARRID